MNWGILGAGSIARRWMTGAVLVPDMRVKAVASRRVQSARVFAEEYGIEIVEESCVALCRREDIDCIYVAAPHTEHAALSILAMKHGKAVLCEKPMAPNRKQVAAMIEAHEKSRVFLMEAMWMRFFPAFQRARKMIAAGAIGEVRAIHAAFAFRIEETDRAHRLLSPALAGGGLLDVGVYGLHFCQGMLGTWPVEKTGLCSLNGGVDEQATMVLRFPNDVLATVHCAVKTAMPDEAVVYGTKGRIVFSRFWAPDGFVVHMANGETQQVSCPVVQDCGFQYEIMHVNECVKNGLLESPEMPLSLSLKMMALCDEFRKMWGIRYPFE
jgi:Predicted dehydrogenases and related proteins